MDNYISEADFSKALFKVCNGDTIVVKRIVDILKNEGSFVKNSIDIMYLKYTGDEILLELFDREDIVCLRKTICVLEGDESVLYSRGKRIGIYTVIHVGTMLVNCLLTKATYKRFASWLYDDGSYEYNRVVYSPSFTFVFEDESSIILFKDKITMIETYTSQENVSKCYEEVRSCTI